METIRDSTGRRRRRQWDGGSYDDHTLRGPMPLYYLGEPIDPQDLEALVEAYRDGYQKASGQDLDDVERISNRLAAEEITRVLDAQILGRFDGERVSKDV